jgi:hypothetical protein
MSVEKQPLGTSPPVGPPVPDFTPDISPLIPHVRRAETVDSAEADACFICVEESMRLLGHR